MKDFKKKYSEFTDWMTEYMKQRTDYWPMLDQIRKDRSEHVDFCMNLFMIWLKDPSKIDWFMENQRLKREK